MARSKWISFGAQQQLQRAAKTATTNATLSLPTSADAKKFGLENFGNTCYANSVLQALYSCTPFRDLLLQDAVSHQTPSSTPASRPVPDRQTVPLVKRKPERKLSTSGHPLEPSNATPPQNSPNPIPASPPTLVAALQSLFLNISTNPGEKGTVAPRAFIDKLKELNELFRSTMHQDAHEFLNYLLNQIVTEIEEEKKRAQNGLNGEDLSNSVATLGSTPPTMATAISSNSGTHLRDATLVHKLFEGALTSETRCLTCETVSSRDESFLDLSIDIEQNSSVTACLRQFSASEMLCQKNKFFCDSCCDLQEAEKRMKIKKLPNVLALHLKRFKYQEDLGRYIKLAYRVAFPFELRLFNTVDDMDDADRLYNLFAIVVHIGNGPHHGHYIAIIKTVGTWLVFDDDNVSSIPESDIPKYFGDSNSGSAYVLYYQAVDIDLAGLGLRSPEPSETLPGSVPALRRSSIPPTPILPPGLDPFLPPDGELEVNQLTPLIPPLPTSTPQPLPVSSNKSPFVLSPVTIPTSQVNDLPALSAPAPMTPTGLGTKIFNTIRRAPSMSAARATIANPNNPSVNVSDNRRSISERSPRPSTTAPSPADGSAQDQPPPLPPLPPSIFNTSQSPSSAVSSPIPIPKVNEPQKDEKEFRSKSPGQWFKKRKSLKLSEKVRPSSSPTGDSPSSPILREEPHHSQTSWFKSSISSSQAPKPQRRPSANGAIPTSEGVGLHPDSRSKSSTAVPVSNLDQKLNGYDDLAHSTGSALSTPSSHSLLQNTQVQTGSIGRHSRSASSTGSGPHFESPPVRKSSLAPSSAERSRSSVDRKKSLDLKTISPSIPSTTSSPHSHNQKNSSHNHDLPPLPSTTKFNPHRSNMSNGHVFVSEPESILKGKSHSTENGDTASNQTVGAHGFPVTLQSTSLAPPTSLATSMGANNSSSSTNSASSNLKRATRKLSLSAPMLGFGKRDKDKEQHEKDRTSPNFITAFLDRRI